MLCSQGNMTKWPVITIAKDGIILQVDSYKTAFKEQHGIMFYSGILIPAFIDIWWKYPSNQMTINELRISEHVNKGTILLGLSDPTEIALEISHKKGPILYPHRIPYSHPEIFPDLLTDNVLPLFEKIKKVLLKNNHIKLAELLSATTSEAALATNHPELGKLEKGCSPGLLLLQNADLVNLKMTPQTTVKWLVYPKNNNF
ncbi:hypothetical protein ACT29H_15305 [Thermophagus sp. OGC60D27]|uniref:hypothetical protein n=1 Tax=Thermophagus sp. OGC60D27 TaxID=3458415 RepID=UPI004037842D